MNRDRLLLDAAAHPSGEEVALCLLRAGANPNTVDAEGKSVLYAAVSNRHKELTRALLQQGVRARDVFTKRKLWRRRVSHSWIEVAGCEAIASLLLEHGADPRIQSKDRSTPLHIACEQGWVLMVDALLERGAQCNTLNRCSESPLMLACELKDQSIALKLLAFGADPHTVSKNGNTALHRACTRGHFTTCQELIAQDVAVNEADKRGKTPLIMAAESCAGLDVIRLLLGAGANINQANKRGETPLIAAAGSCAGLDVIRVLLEAGADINQADKWGKTPLMMAAGSCAGLDVIRFLLEAGADPHVENHEHKTALHYALLGTEPDEQIVTGLLKEEIAPKPGSEEEDSLLRRIVGCESSVHLLEILAPLTLPSWLMGLACREGDVKFAMALLEKEVDLDETGRWGMTPLMHAALLKNGETLALALLNHGADAHVLDRRGFSVLHFACHTGHKELVKALLAQGVQTDQQSTVKNHSSQGVKPFVDFWTSYGSGVTPLMVAANSKAGEEVALDLLKAGANATLIDCRGQTALYYACEIGHSKLIRALFDHGVAIDLPDSQGESPLVYVLDSRFRIDKPLEEIVQFLLEHGADPHVTTQEKSTCLMLAANSQQCWRWLLDKGADVHAVNLLGSTALHCACRAGNVELVETLLQRGSSVHQLNNNEESALLCAAGCSSSDACALYLLEKGADPCLVDCDGKSALHRASFKGHETLVKALIDRNVSIDSPDELGRTPLIEALDTDCGQEIAQLLLDRGADPFQLDRNGSSAFHRALRREDHPLAMKMLESVLGETE